MSGMISNGNGQMVTGWKLDGDKWYFLFDTGSMARGGWAMIDKKWYCFRDNGELETGKILEFEGKKYYVNEDGVMIIREDQETVTYKKVTYDVAEDGVCTAIRNPLQEKIETWCEHVDTISQWYVEKVKTYLDGPIVDGSKTRKPYKCPYLNNEEVGDDCSSHVSASLALANFMPYAGYVSQNFNPVEKKYSASLGVKFNKAGFFWYINDANYIPQRGDIFVQHKWYTNDKGEPAQYHHVEVVSSYDLDTDKCNVWSWGAVYGYLPRPQPNWKKRTTGYWRIEE